MERKNLSLSTDSITISGEYYSVSNGFLKKNDGTVRLRYKDLLSATCVNRRSKKAMYMVLLLGAILLSLLSMTRVNIQGNISESMTKIQTLQGTYDSVKNVYETTQNFDKEGLYNIIKNGVTVLIVLVVFMTISGVLYLFSKQAYVELVTMQGTYRIVLHRNDPNMRNIVAELQSKINSFHY